MNLVDKKIVILGAGGKLGRALAQSFSDCPRTLFVKKEGLDCRDENAVMRFFDEHKPDIIINATAYNAVDACEDAGFLQEALAVNAHAVGNLAQGCKKSRALLIHFSSDYVFAGNAPAGYAEADLVKPVNAYGWTKWLGEEAIVAARIPHYIIRTSRLFGLPGTSAHGKSSIIEQIIALAATSEKIDVVDSEQASPTYSLDLARATRELLEKDFAHGLYHITNSGACSRYEFYSAIARELGLTVKMVPISAADFPRPAARPAYSILLSTKFPPLRPWQEALAEFIKTRTL